ncbi:MAG: PIG-L deacetylase family protein [Caldisericaceae bacterium]
MVNKVILVLVIALVILFCSFLFIHFFKVNRKNLSDNSQLVNYPVIDFCKSDRVLVIAPHPDDEALANSSVILRAKAVGANVKVVFVTFGEHNTETLIKFLFFPSPLASNLLAQRRHKECINAAKTLGLSDSDLVFLGFPDFGNLKIWDNHFSNRPYMSGINLHDKTFYSGVYKKGVPFTALEELKLFEEVISSYHPTKLFYPSTLDLNPDHRATGLFTEAALFDLKTIKPELYTYFVHSEDWPEPVGYFPDDFLGIPSYFSNLDGNWKVSYLSLAQEQIKLNAIKAHLSQYLTKPKFMASFARKDEIFCTTYEYGTGKELPLWTEEVMHKVGILPYIESVTVSDKNDSYEFKMKLYKGVPPFSKLNLFVYPEISGKPFADSPKYRLVIERGVKKEIELTLFDRGTEIVSQKDRLTGSFGELLLTVDIEKTHFEGSKEFFFSILGEEGNYRVTETPWWLIDAQSSTK